MKLLVLVLMVLVGLLGMTMQRDCSAAFQLLGSHCVGVISATVKRNLFEQCEYCAAHNAHIMSLREARELSALIDHGLYEPIRSNFLLTGSQQEPIYDAELGFLTFSSETPNFEPSSSLNGVFVNVKLSTFKAMAKSILIRSLGFCLENRKPVEKTSYQFIVGFEGQARSYHSLDVAKQFSKFIGATSKLLCLVECAKNQYCSTAYYSKSKRRCSHRIYMDTFLHQDDKNVAEDFQRYALYR